MRLQPADSVLLTQFADGSDYILLYLTFHRLIRAGHELLTTRGISYKVATPTAADPAAAAAGRRTCGRSRTTVRFLTRTQNAFFGGSEAGLGELGPVSRPTVLVGTV